MSAEHLQNCWFLCVIYIIYIIYFLLPFKPYGRHHTGILVYAPILHISASAQFVNKKNIENTGNQNPLSNIFLFNN